MYCGLCQKLFWQEQNWEDYSDLPSGRKTLWVIKYLEFGLCASFISAENRWMCNVGVQQFLGVIIKIPQSQWSMGPCSMDIHKKLWKTGGWEEDEWGSLWVEIKTGRLLSSGHHGLNRLALGNINLLSSKYLITDLGVGKTHLLSSFPRLWKVDLQVYLSNPFSFFPQVLPCLVNMLGGWI